MRRIYTQIYLCDKWWICDANVQFFERHRALSLWEWKTTMKEKSVVCWHLSNIVCSMRATKQLYHDPCDTVTTAWLIAWYLLGGRESLICAKVIWLARLTAVLSANKSNLFGVSAYVWRWRGLCLPTFLLITKHPSRTCAGSLYAPRHRGPGIEPTTLEWRHNERDGVSKYRRLDCLLNLLFMWISKKTSKLRVTGLCEGNPPVTGGFPHRGPLTRFFPFDNVIMKYAPGCVVLGLIVFVS